MSSVSKTQQRLMGMAWAVRKGELDKSDVDDEVLDVADGKMSDKSLRKFAKTKHKGLPEKISENFTTDCLKDYIREYSIHKSKRRIDKWIKAHCIGQHRLLYLTPGGIKLTRGHIVITTDEETIPSYIIFNKIQGDISIENCPNLTTIQGIFNPDIEAEGNIDISQCPKLTSIEGLPYIIGKNLTIVSCPNIKDKGENNIKVLGSVYVNKSGRRWKDNDFKCDDVEIKESLDIINEELNEPHLLALQRQLGKKGEWSKYYKLFKDNTTDWKSIRPSMVREYDESDNIRFTKCRQIISRKKIGMILLKDSDLYNYIISGDKFVLDLNNNTVEEMSYKDIMDLIKDSEKVICVDISNAPVLGRKINNVINNDLT